MRAGILAGITLLLTSIALFAAPPASLDTIHLKNGDLVRGTIVEVKKGESIKIQTTDGELRVISFEKIESYGLGFDRAEAPPPTATPSAIPPPLPTPQKADPMPGARPLDSANTVTVTYQSETPNGQLFMHFDELTPPLIELATRPSLTVGRNTYWYVCSSPCTDRIPQGHYSFGVRTSDGFRQGGSMALNQDSSLRDVTTHFDGDKSKGPNVPWLVTGAVTTVAGAILTVYAITLLTTPEPNPATNKAGWTHAMNQQSTGVILLTPAVLLAVGGIVIFSLTLATGHSGARPPHDEFHIEQVKLGASLGGMQLSGQF